MDVFRCRRDAPTRPTDWRWRLATFLAADPALSRVTRVDDWTARALRFLRKLPVCGGPAGRAALAGDDPDVSAAHEFWEAGDRPARWALEARLLSGEGGEAVAARSALSPGAVRAVEALFFNVWDRLDAPDFILYGVIGDPAARGPRPHEIDAVWKLFAYRYGPAGLDAVMGAGRVPGGTPGGPAGEHFERATAEGLGRAAAAAAITVRVTPGNAAGLIRLYLRLERGAPPPPGGGDAGIEENVRAMAAYLLRPPRGAPPGADAPEGGTR